MTQILNSRLNQYSDDAGFRETRLGQEFERQPLGFVDVGARGGVHEIVEPLARLTAVLGFEPDLEELKRLRESVGPNSPWARFELEPAALAQGDGQARLRLYPTPSNHSLLRPNLVFTRRYRMRNFELVGEMPLRTVSLDHVLFSSRESDPVNWGEIMKLDTQGTELDILRGAERTLRERSVALVVETEFWPVYEGQKLFSETELFLRQAGFSLYGFFNMQSRSLRKLDKRREAGRERLFYADAVFFKDPLCGWPVSQKLNSRQMNALFLSVVTLGYFDFGLELLDQPGWSGYEDREKLTAFLHRLAALPPDHSRDAVRDLSKRVESDPASASIEVGQFVDSRRDRCNYYDALLPPNEGPLP